MLSQSQHGPAKKAKSAMTVRRGSISAFLVVLMGASVSAQNFDFDCNAPSSCTNSVLNKYATDQSGSFKCGNRIQWVMDNHPKNMLDACLYIGKTLSACRRCIPPLTTYNFDCDVPDKCTPGVLNTYASGPGGTFKCGDRIKYVLDNHQPAKTEQEACYYVANEAAACSPCSSGGSIQQAPPTSVKLETQSLRWSDEFSNEGDPSDTYWNYEIGNGNWGWGNGELQYYKSSQTNVNVKNGNLNINVLAEEVGGFGFTSARVKTDGKVAVKYGSIEARIKLPNVEGGLWPAFWLLGSSVGDVGWPSCGEIDILEATNNNKWVSSAAHWESGGYASYGDNINTSFDISAGYYTYRLDWTPNFINTFIDDNHIWSFDIGSCKDTSCTEFHKPFYFILNVAVGGKFAGIMERSQVTAQLPQTMSVDYIRIYDNTQVQAQLFGTGIGMSRADTPQETSTTALAPTPSSTPSLTPNPPAPTPTPTPIPSSTPLVVDNSTGIDCGVPDTCTSAVLNTNVGNGSTCRSNIEDLMNQDHDELYACDVVARKNFPTQCGGCNHGLGPFNVDYNFDCGAPDRCTSTVLNREAPMLDATCGERIKLLIESAGNSEAEACRTIAGEEFPSYCGPCVHASITCGKPQVCNDSVLESDADGSSCRSRISDIVSGGRTEEEACRQVANESFIKGDCSACDP